MFISQIKSITILTIYVNNESMIYPISSKSLSSWVVSLCLEYALSTQPNQHHSASPSIHEYYLNIKKLFTMLSNWWFMAPMNKSFNFFIPSRNLKFTIRKISYPIIIIADQRWIKLARDIHFKFKIGRFDRQHRLISSAATGIYGGRS